MNDRDLTTRLLGTPGDDPGCDGSFALLAEYVDGELEGRNVRELFPSVAEHLRNCPACAEDHEGLVALARGRRPG